MQEEKRLFKLRSPDSPIRAVIFKRLDIVKDGGAVVQAYRATPAYSISWSLTIEDGISRYFFVRVWNAEGGDTAGGKTAYPVAWLAPVWTGR